MTPSEERIIPARPGGLGPRSHRWRIVLKTVFGVFLIAIALGLLAYKTRSIDAGALRSALQDTAPQKLLWASLVTVASYVVLSCIDVLALRHLRRPLPYPEVLRNSFIAYCFNFNFGMLVGSVALRYRLYGKMGVSHGDIARVSLYAALSAAVGYAVVGGLTFSLFRIETPTAIRLPIANLSPWGVLLLVAAAAYFLACHLQLRPLRLRRWHFALPDLAHALVQTAVASTQWLLISLVIFLLLPHEPQLRYHDVLAVYLVAACIGAVTHIPGGLGVLEGVFLVMLAGRLPDATILGALVAFRVLYYLVPLGLACACLALTEGRRHFAGQQAALTG